MNAVRLSSLYRIIDGHFFRWLGLRAAIYAASVIVAAATFMVADVIYSAAVPIGPSKHVQNTIYIPLTELNAKDIWSTSVYSYAPGGGEPGGGRADEYLKVGGWGDRYVSLVQFDLPKISCTCNVALQLYATTSGANSTAMYLRRIMQPWDWKPGDRLWWTDIPRSTLLENQITPAPTTETWTTVDISNLFRRWCSAEFPNFGLMLTPVDTNNNFNFFYSTHNIAVPSRNPRLAVTCDDLIGESQVKGN